MNRSLDLKKLVAGAQRNIHIVIVQRCQTFFRGRIQDAHVFEIFLTGEFPGSLLHCSHKAAHKICRVAVCVVFALENHRIIADNHSDIQHPFCFVCRKRLHLRRFSAQSIEDKAVALIIKHDIGGHVESLGNIREGEQIGRHAVHKLVFDGTDQIRHPVVFTDAADHRQGLDQHGYGPLHAGILSAMVDGRVKGFIKKVVPHEHKGEHRIVERVLRYPVFAAPGLHCMMIKPG